MSILSSRSGAIFLSLALLMWNVIFFHSIIDIGINIWICLFHGLSILCFAVGIQACLMDYSEKKLWLFYYSIWTWIHLVVTTAFTFVMVMVTIWTPEFQCTLLCPDSSVACVLSVIFSKWIMSVALVFTVRFASTKESVDLEAVITPPWDVSVSEPLPSYSLKEANPPAYTN